MNFGEKLTNLRKQKGLSQEELGYELNVTRQTISKWELGQTTPEMDKLVEMSKIFGITVDELTNAGEVTSEEVKKIEDRPINDKPQSNSTLKVILIIVAVCIIGGMMVYGVIFSKAFNFGKKVFDEVTNRADSIIDQAGNISDKTSGLQENFEENYNKAQQQIEEMQKKAEKEQENFEKNSFNNGFEIYGGTKTGFHIKTLLDKIITNNKTQKEKTIIVVYKGEKITDVDKLKSIKKDLGDFTDYEVSFEYDENGYIYQAEIEKF